MLAVQKEVKGRSYNYIAKTPISTTLVLSNNNKIKTITKSHFEFRGVGMGGLALNVIIYFFTLTHSYDIFGNFMTNKFSWLPQRAFFIDFLSMLC